MGVRRRSISSFFYKEIFSLCQECADIAIAVIVLSLPLFLSFSCLNFFCLHFFFLCPPALPPAILLFFNFICSPDLLIEVRRPEMMAAKLSLFGLFAVVSSPKSTFDDLVQCLPTVNPGSPGSFLISTLTSIREVPLLSFYLTSRVKFRVHFFKGFCDCVFRLILSIYLNILTFIHCDSNSCQSPRSNFKRMSCFPN